MSNTCIVLREIETLSQSVVNFLSNPATFTPTDAQLLISQIELVRGAVRNLPLAAGIKEDILGRLLQAQLLLQTNMMTAFNILTSVLQILQVVVLKVNNHPVPCTQGLTIVHESNCFNTICQCCR